MICTPHQISYREEWDGRGTGQIQWTGYLHRGFWWGALREWDHLEVLSIYGGKILKVIFKKDEVGAGGLDGIDVALDRDKWRALENVVMDRTDCIIATQKWPQAQQPSKTWIFPWRDRGLVWRNGNEGEGEDCRKVRVMEGIVRSTLLLRGNKKKTRSKL